MVSHKTSLNKFKNIEIIPGIFFQWQWSETRNQLQNKSRKIHKYVEIQQHLVSGLKMSKGKSKNTLKHMKMEIPHTKNLRDAAKAVLRGTFIVISPYILREKKIFK